MKPNPRKQLTFDEFVQLADQLEAQGLLESVVGDDGQRRRRLTALGRQVLERGKVDRDLKGDRS